MSPLQRLAALVGPRRFLRLICLYPPFLGAGVRVRGAAPDLSRVEVEMRLAPWNRNFVGTHFGGSLYSARLEEIRREADRNRKVLPRFEVTVVDGEGQPVARVQKTLYVRRKQPDAGAAARAGA